MFSQFAERIRCGFGKSAAHSAHSSRVLTFSTVQCLVRWEIVVMWRGRECTGSNRHVRFVTGILSLGKISLNPWNEWLMIDWSNECRNANNCYKVEIKIPFILNLEHWTIHIFLGKVLNNMNTGVKHLKHCMSAGCSWCGEQGGDLLDANPQGQAACLVDLHFANIHKHLVPYILQIYNTSYFGSVYWANNDDGCGQGKADTSR